MADQTISSPYKSIVVSTIAAGDTTVTLHSSSTDHFEQADVGRVIWSQQDKAYRRIVSVEDSENCTVDAQWGISPFRAETSLVDGNRMSESTPGTFDTTVISYTWNDIFTDFNPNNEISFDSNTNTYRFTGADTYIFPEDSNVVVYDEDITLAYNYVTSFDVGPNNMIIFGRQNIGTDTDADINGYPSHGCHLIDRNISTSTSQNRGGWHMNGCYFEGTGSLNNFYRFNDASNSTNDGNQDFRMWNCTIEGNFGGRFSGDTTVIMDNIIVGNTNTLGINPIAPAIFTRNTVRDSINALYSYPLQAGSTTAGPMDLQDITSEIMFMNRGGASVQTQTLLNWSIDQIEGIVNDNNDVDLIVTSGSHNANQAITFEKDYNVEVTEADGAAISGETGKFHSINQVNVAETDDTDDGIFTSTLQAYRAVINSTTSTIEDFNGSTVSQRTPIDWAIKYRGFNLISGNTNLAGPVGPIDIGRPRVEDINVTDTSAQIDAYTEIATTDQLYNYADKFKYDDLTLPTLTTQWFSKSGSVVSSTSDVQPIILKESFTDVFGINSSFSDTFTARTTPPFISDGQWGIRDDSDSEAESVHSLPSSWSSLVGDWLHFSDSDGSRELPLKFAAVIAAGEGIDLTQNVGGATHSATFTIDRMNVFVDSNGRLITAVHLESVGANAGQVQPTQVLDISSSDSQLIELKNSVTGMTGDLTAGYLHFDTEIRCGVNADGIFITDTDGGNIIDTTEAISGNLYLNASANSYMIRNADVSDLIVHRIGTGTVSVVLENTTGSIGLADGAVEDTFLTINVSGTGLRSSVGRITVFNLEQDSETVQKDTEGTTMAIDGAVDNFLSAGTDIRVVWSGSDSDGVGFKSVVMDHTVLGGSNTLEITVDQEPYPDTPPTNGASIAAASTFDSANKRVVFDLSGSATRMTDSQTNYFMQTELKGTSNLNRVISSNNDATVVRSLGAASTAAMNGEAVRLQPGENISQNLGYILNDSTTVTIGQDLNVTAEIGGQTETLTFIVNIEDNPAAFDLPATRTAIEEDVLAIVQDENAAIKRNTALIPGLL